MKVQRIKTGLWLHTLITILAGFSLFLFPKNIGPLWPWALPPLAARFMGSLLIGGGVCTALVALAPEPLPLTGATGRMIIWLVLFIGTTLLLWALFFLYNGQASHANDQRPLTRGLRIYFKIHMAVVIPVGLTMYLAPTLAQQLWPWALSPVNIRLLGAFFVGASLLSAWSLRQKDWRAVQPLVALYAVFTTLTTLASILHFNLFNPARMITWAFFALYIFVAGGAWFFLARFARK